jgi:site-specific DNA-methyltransferase (adenine-specific)
MIDLRKGDCIEQMRQLPPNSVDSIVTDPPYELGFMGKSWDSTGIAYSVKMWDEALRVLKPGGHLLAFSGSRTYHRMACAIEDAGFEIRDQIMWVYGSGFPKSMDVSKAIDKQAGAKREVVGSVKNPLKRGTVLVGERSDAAAGMFSGVNTQIDITAPTTDKAKQWAGWGTALKPAHEPIVLARKPLIGTVATNVIIHGTGALNIDGSRVEFQSEADKASATPQGKVTVNVVGNMPDVDNDGRKELERPDNSKGRWPANFIHDGSDEVVELFPDTKSGRLNTATITAENLTYGTRPKELATEFDYADSGSAARFFYCAKASKKDRNEGLDGFVEKRPDDRSETGMGTFTEKGVAKQSNHHPTVKPTELMRYLVRLVTPPDGTVLDPFMGSGSTGKAAVLERFSFIGIDQSADYLEIATARIKHAEQQIEGQLL